MPITRGWQRELDRAQRHCKYCAKPCGKFAAARGSNRAVWHHTLENGQPDYKADDDHSAAPNPLDE